MRMQSNQKNMSELNRERRSQPFHSLNLRPNRQGERSSGDKSMTEQKKEENDTEENSLKQLGIVNDKPDSPPKM